MRTQGMMTTRAAIALSAGVLAAVTLTGCSSDAAHDAGAKGSQAAASAKAAGSSAKAAAASARARAQASMSARASAKADSTKLIETVQWVSTSGGGSLHVTPTQAGRTDTSPTGNVAWIQVERAAKAAGGQEAAVVDKPGMKAQFVCHWQFARVKDPKKASWNLEPWRPVVSEKALIQARCNPGGAEGPDQ